MIELLLQAERALSVGLLDRAETLYRQVASADPRNSIAVVGLSRVTLDRGDEVAALDLARDALAIDPENVAAQRMIARLEEVINYRGAAAEAAIAEIDAVGLVVAAQPAAVEPETTEPEPETEPAADVAAAKTEIASEPERADPDAVVVPETAPEQQPEILPEPEPAEPEPPRRRSFLDRLFRRR